MAALADQDVLCDPPLLEDYLTVLECWHLASSLENDDQYNKSSSNNNISLVLKHVEELWIQMKERQRREMMMNDTQHFVINERAYELVASLLAKAGQAVPAEQVVEEAIAQEQLRRSGKRYNYPVSPESSNSSKENHEGEEPSPQIGLNLCHAVLQAHLRSKETKAPQRAEAFLQKMRTDSSLPIPDVNSYNLVLERWMMASKATTNKDAMISIAKRIEDLIHQMKETDRIQPNLISYQYGIDALARSGNPIRSETMLANLVKDYFLQYDADLKPSIAPFQSVLWAYSKAASEGPVKQRLEDAANRAEGILNDMIELSTLLDTYPTVWSYNIVMKCWAHSKSNDASARTSALYEQLLQLPPADDNISGEKRVDTNQDDEEDPFRNRPSDLGPDRTSMNTLLKVLSTNEGAARAEEKLWEFYDDHIRDPKRNPSPDTIAFSTTIHAWSKTSHLDSAERADALLRKLIELYDNGKKKAHKPDIVTYTNVMQCWTKSKQPGAPEKVESILREVQRMERDGDTSMKPDAACWNTAISAWAAEGNGENAERLFFEMVDNANTSNGASPTPITLTNVLKAWTNCMSPEAPERATKLLAGMEELYEHGTLKIKPNVVNYTVVLDCLAYARTSSAAEIAENMLKDMVSSEDPNLRPNVVSYNSVIKAWSHAKDPESASKITILLRDLIDQSERDSNLKPTENTFGTILKFLADSDLPDKAERAMSIQNLMGIFLDDRKPVQPWVEKELRRCMSDS